MINIPLPPSKGEFIKRYRHSGLSRIIPINLLLTIFIILTSLPSQAETQKYIQAQYIMGTIFKIELYSDNQQKANLAFKNAFSEIRKCDLILSDYRQDSELSKILEESSSHPVKVSDDFFYITQRSLYFSKITDGAFDITIEPLVRLWGFKEKIFVKPDNKQIEEVKKQIGYQNIMLDNENKTVYLKNPYLKMDFGAIGKGYAIDKAVKVIKEAGIKSAFIDSVSNQYYLGSPPNQKFWQVGIKNPRNLNQVIKYLYLKNKSISTSGDYEQFFIENNTRYSHIINPKTGYPIKDAIASTIITDNSADADALSTSVLLLNDLQTNKIIKLFPKTQLIKINLENNQIKMKEYAN